MVVFCVVLGLLNARGQNPFWGVQTHFGQYYRADMDSASVIRMLDSVSEAGIRLIRDECYWSYVETTPGIYNFPPQIDFYIQQAQLRGIGILLILNYNNSLYAPHAGSAVTTDSNRAKFVSYCQAVVSRYLPLGVKCYEIWNEPNIPMFWDPTPNANDYFKLLQAVYPVIKSIDTTITVMGCATSPAEGNPAPFISWLSFIGSVFSLGGGNYMDAVSFHQYRVDKNPEQWIQNDINSLKNIVGTKPIWLTEVGYHTATVWPNLTELAQAQYVSRLYIMGKGIQQLSNIFYYDLKNDGTSANEPEHNFGLLNFNMIPKPAFLALRTAAQEIKDEVLLSSNVANGNYRYLFSNSLDRTYVFWNPTTVSSKSELFPSNALRITKMDGERYFIYDKDKVVTVDYEQSPKYYTPLNELPAQIGYSISPALDSIVAGQKINLNLEGATSDNMKVIVDPAAVGWSVSDTVATIDSVGKLTAKYPGVCVISADFQGQTIHRTIYILPGFVYKEIESFNTTDNFQVSFFNMLPATAVAVTDTNFTTPGKSLRVDYEFQYLGIDKHRVIFDCNYPLPGEPDSVLIDIYNNGNGHVFSFQFEDADGGLFSSNSLQSMINNKTGWTTAKASLKSFGSGFNYPAKLIRVIFYAVKNSGVINTMYSGRVLLDNLRIHNGIVSSAEEIRTTGNATGFELYQNYPNPFNPKTVIGYSIEKGGFVKLSIYDIKGEAVEVPVNGFREAGYYETEFDGSKLASGIYFYEIRIDGEKGAPGFRNIKKMTLIK